MYAIHVRGGTSTAEDAAVLTAFNTLITALKAASAHKVDSGGTIIGGKFYTTDESNPHVRQGDTF